MSAYQLHLAGREEIQREEERRKQLKVELDQCTEVRDRYRNKIYPFLIESGIEHLAEIDYELRVRFQSYAKQKFLQNQRQTMVNMFDRIKQQTMWEAQKTLAGRQKYKLKYENTLMFLRYFPDREIAEKYVHTVEENQLVWDFRIACSEKMKQQIFNAICSISREKKDSWSRKIALDGLKYFYQFCIKNNVSDIERIEPEKIRKYADSVRVLNKAEKVKVSMTNIVNWIQEHEFVNAEEIHWYADVWYLERIHISKERIDQSKSMESLRFTEVEDQDNRELFKQYMKYLLAVTNLSLSSICSKNAWLRSYMKYLDQKAIKAENLTKQNFEDYLRKMYEKNMTSDGFNAVLLSVTQFYNFLLVRGKINRMPFQPDEYRQKQFYIHHERSVENDVSNEIICKLQYFPEHLRLMYLHLWGIGLRASEVCTLKGNAYEWDGRDAWIQVWQPKMRKYKRVPIPEMLYRLMKVYIKKYMIGADDYLFPNTNGGAFQYSTLRSQMLKYCKKYRIQGGEYIFRSHDYRHSVATEFYNGGVPLSSVRDYHGHTYDEMTLQYVDHMPERVELAETAIFQNPENNLATELIKGFGREKDTGENV